MTLITNTSTGRYDTDANEVMDHVRKPVFVDNAVHHGRISVQTSNKAKITVEKNNTRNLQVMPQTRYQIVESEGGVQLTHVQKSGHEYTGVPYFNGETLSSSNIPILLYNADNPSERIVLSDVENSTIGVFGNLRNMKGRTLQDIGFTSDIVKLGQPVDVGLRTTDLAIKLGESVDSGVTSVNIARPESTVATHRHHSTRFIAKDFQNTNLMTSLRFLARHDGRMVLLDAFGNLLYIPLTFSESTINITDKLSNTTQSNPVDNTFNRVTVQGLPMALNDLVIVTVDDTESQVTDIREAPAPIVDHTVRSVRPGMTVVHEGRNKLITEVRHYPLQNRSDFALMNVEVGLEGILQGIDEGSTIDANETNPATYMQVVDTNLALFGKVELRFETKIIENAVYSTAILIGGNTRGKIGGGNEPLGGNKSHHLAQTKEVYTSQ